MNDAVLAGVESEGVLVNVRDVTDGLAHTFPIGPGAASGVAKGGRSVPRAAVRGGTREPEKPDGT